MARLAWTAPVCAGLILTLASSVALADPSAAELASARDMFSEARRAEDAGRWAEALVKLKAVANVKLTPQVRFHLGLCEEHTGQLVEALNSFELARAEAIEQGVGAVMDEARDHAASVRSRVPKLLIVLPNGADAKVEVDGQAISSGLLARPLPFDPGRHTISASAPGQAFSREVTISERDEKRIDVVFTSVPVASAPKTPAAPPTAASASPPSSAPAATTPSGDTGTAARGSSALGWVAVGAGGAVLAGAAITAVLRQDSIKKIDDVCPSHTDCPRSLQGSLEDSQSKARTYGALAVALGAGGGALVVTGLVLALTAAPSAAPSTGLAVSPWLANNGGGVLGAMSW
jgi:hypothetical protein